MEHLNFLDLGVLTC